MQFAYPTRLSRDRKDCGFIVRCRDTIVRAIADAEGALQAAIEDRTEDCLETPRPSAPKRGERIVATPGTTVLKAAV